MRKDLWERKEFGVDDCFPIREGDVWDVQPKHLNFAENFWGEGKKRSFLWAAKQAMANRGRGRGPRPRNPEEEWVDWSGGGWNQIPPHPYPPHQPQPSSFFNQMPPPPPYGYYHNQVQHPPPPFFGQQFSGPRPRGGAGKVLAEVEEWWGGSRLGQIKA